MADSYQNNATDHQTNACPCTCQQPCNKDITCQPVVPCGSLSNWMPCGHGSNHIDSAYTRLTAVSSHSQIQSELKAELVKVQEDLIKAQNDNQQYRQCTDQQIKELRSQLEELRLQMEELRSQFTHSERQHALEMQNLKSQAVTGTVEHKLFTLGSMDENHTSPHLLDESSHQEMEERKAARFMRVEKKVSIPNSHNTGIGNRKDSGVSISSAYSIDDSECDDPSTPSSRHSSLSELPKKPPSIKKTPNLDDVPELYD